MASDRVKRQIDSLLDDAESAIKQLDWKVVRDRAEAVLAIDPENPDGRTYLTTAERAMGGAAPEPTGQPETLLPATAPIATPEHPTSFADGRYQVKRFLGEGGKKRVYLAQDTLLDREVAFALIKTDVSAQRREAGHIFISHVAEDSSIAIQTAEALEAKGYSTWYYERDSVPGPWPSPAS